MDKLASENFSFDHFKQTLLQNRKAVISHVLTVAAAAIVIGTTMFFSDGWFAKGIQLALFAGLGWLHNNRQQEQLAKDGLAEDGFLYTLLIAVIIAVLLLAMYLVAGAETLIMAAASSCAFLLPYTLGNAWVTYNNIPREAPLISLPAVKERPALAAPKPPAPQIEEVIQPVPEPIEETLVTPAAPVQEAPVIPPPVEEVVPPIEEIEEAVVVPPPPPPPKPKITVTPPPPKTIKQVPPKKRERPLAKEPIVIKPKPAPVAPPPPQEEAPMVKMPEPAPVSAKPASTEKVWFPTDEVIEKKATVFLNSLPIHIKLSRSLTSEATSFPLQAPVKMKLGTMFYHFIQDKNKAPESAIEFKNARDAFYGWEFYTEAFGGLKKRYLNPELTLIDNKIKQNATIVAQRVSM